MNLKTGAEDTIEIAYENHVGIDRLDIVHNFVVTWRSYEMHLFDAHNHTRKFDLTGDLNGAKIMAVARNGYSFVVFLESYELGSNEVYKKVYKVAVYAIHNQEPSKVKTVDLPTALGKQLPANPTVLISTDMSLSIQCDNLKDSDDVHIFKDFYENREEG